MIIDPATGLPEPRSNCVGSWDKIHNGGRFKQKKVKYVPFESRRPCLTAKAWERKRQSQILIERYRRAEFKYRILRQYSEAKVESDAGGQFIIVNNNKINL